MANLAVRPRLTPLAESTLTKQAQETNAFYGHHATETYKKVHIPNLTRATLLLAKSLKDRAKAIIINPNDRPNLPTPALMTIFQTVVYISSPLQKVPSTPKLEFRSPDLTGILEPLSHLCEQRVKKVNKGAQFIKEIPDLLDLIKFPPHSVEDFGKPHSYSLVISHYATFDLPVKIQSYLLALIKDKYKLPPEKLTSYPPFQTSLGKLSGRMQANHLGLLHHLVTPDGKVLFCDVESREIPRLTKNLKVPMLFPELSIKQEELFDTDKTESWDVEVVAEETCLGLMFLPSGPQPAYTKIPSTVEHMTCKILHPLPPLDCDEKNFSSEYSLPNGRIPRKRVNHFQKSHPLYLTLKFVHLSIEKFLSRE